MDMCWHKNVSQHGNLMLPEFAADGARKEFADSLVSQVWPHAER